MLAMLGSAGCAEDPSFSLRWAIRRGDEDEATTLRSPRQCREVGIARVRATTLRNGETVDVSEFQCFPDAFEDEDATVAGPELDAGDYVVRFEALSQAGDPWTDADGNPLVREEKKIDVRDEVTPTLRFVLDALPQCMDGVDNDRDGAVDADDSACQGSNANVREDAGTGTSRLELSLSLLQQNPNILACTQVSTQLRWFEILVDDDPATRQRLACTEVVNSTAVLELPLSPGNHTVSVLGVASDGTALTSVLDRNITVLEGTFNVFPLQFDFGSKAFLQPIVAPARILLSYANTNVFRRGCDANGFGTLELEQVRISVRDGHGGALTPPPTTVDGIALDGRAIACPTSWIMTEPLPWGAYLVDVEALSAAGDVCFSTAANPLVLAPQAFGDLQALTIPRVFPIAPSCSDCVTDADCNGGTCAEQQGGSICVPAI